MKREQSKQEPITEWEKSEALEEKGKTAFQGPPPVAALAMGMAKLFEGLSPEDAQGVCNLMKEIGPRPRTPVTLEDFKGMSRMEAEEFRDLLIRLGHKCPDLPPLIE